MAKHKPNSGPIIIDTSDTSPQDMGGGYKLSFQESKNDANKVRAVVKAPDGSIYAKSEVHPRDNAFAARIGAISRARKRTYNASLGLPPDATKDQQLKALEDMMLKMYPGFKP